MTIIPFLTDNVVVPQDIQAMSTVLEDVCKILNLADEGRSERELVAKKLVALAHQGSRDAGLLRDRVLRETASDQSEWSRTLVRGRNAQQLSR